MPCPQPAPPIRIPCPVNDGRNHSFQGLYFTGALQEPVPVDVVTIFPPVENALSKRYPVFENILGSSPQVHECTVRIFDIEHKEYTFLIAYQPRPHSPPNQAVSKLFPHVRVRGEILVVRSGKSVLIQAMGGRAAVAAAKLAVSKFAIELDHHMSRYRGKRVVPPLPTFIDWM